MKLLDYFRTFMTDVVNLNDTRVSQLEASIEAIKSAIRTSDWKPKIRRFEPQGSWAHKTIIKPLQDDAFDADLLVFVDPVNGWTAKEYISTLRAMFAGHPTYKDKVQRFSHCVTINYARERKIDIAPCIIDRLGYPAFEVCNFNTDDFELSEPEKYTTWLIERNGWTGGNGLRKVTRLLKYLRDNKTTFTCPSVLFTTLLGQQIVQADSFNEADFADLPTSLKTIVGRLDDWLQARPLKPRVANPVLGSEVFSNLWTDNQYSNFRDKIQTYRSWIDDAYNEPDRDESIGKWRRVFGDEFAEAAVLDEGKRVSDDARIIAENSFLIARGVGDDLVSLFTRFGRRILPGYFDRIAYKQRPRWRVISPPLFKVVVTARQHDSKNGVWLADIKSGDGPLSKGHWLQFLAQTGVGSSIGPEYEINWRVTNTDKQAALAGALRGGFETSNDGASRWEALKYRGVHTVEAFVVRKRDNALVAQSEPFYVVIA